MAIFDKLQYGGLTVNALVGSDTYTVARQLHLSGTILFVAETYEPSRRSSRSDNLDWKRGNGSSGENKIFINVTKRQMKNSF